MLQVLTCPACLGRVEPSSAACFTCHLPMRDVVRHQSDTRTGRRIWSRLVGLVSYAAIAAWCWWQLEDAMAFVVPAAVAGAYLHAVRGRPIVGALVFVVVAFVVPVFFWPTLLTGTYADLTGRF